MAYHGNVVDLLEYLYNKNIHVELASDQTSCHEPYTGGYTPAGYTFAEGRKLMESDPEGFHRAVDASLRKHIDLVRRLEQRGTRFWDYGNRSSRRYTTPESGTWPSSRTIRLPGSFSPVTWKHIMGPMCFDYGYGPFRWVCLSGKPEDLR
jgi:urocanate hydratase